MQAIKWVLPRGPNKMMSDIINAVMLSMGSDTLTMDNGRYWHRHRHRRTSHRVTINHKTTKQSENERIEIQIKSNESDPLNAN